MAFSSSDDFLADLHRLQRQFDAIPPLLEQSFVDKDRGVEGHVVVWNGAICENGPLFDNGIGCGKGGTRVQAGLSLEHVKRLARAMAQKNAAAGLPLGGAKSGLNLDPNDPDYEQKWKIFVQMVKDSGILYEDGGVFGGFGYDVGCKPPLNALWTIEQLGYGRSMTGKPAEYGGTDYDKRGIAGVGVAVAARTLLVVQTGAAAGKSYAVQGVGAMGGAVLRYFAEFGGILKAVSDLKYGGTWVFDEKPSKKLLEDPSAENVAIEARKVSDDVTGALYADVDVVFPCALEDAITIGNYNQIKAPFIVEGANNPTTDDAHQVLYKDGKFVVPDIIANPGGIIAAYVEMTSGAEDKAAEAFALSEDRIAQNVVQLISLVKEYDVSPDLVADYITYKNIFKEGA